MNPKVFICHASEDKERFVLKFAEKLRAKGIDAWVDKWEIFLGDSLVKKIFEEGIKEAKAFIIILSNNSINKSWVKAELDVAIVKKIEGETRLIPLLIDSCNVPECLKATTWERIQDINNYDDKLETIVMSIFEKNQKPPLGKPPQYVQDNTAIRLPELTDIDSKVFKIIYDYAIEKDKTYCILLTNINDRVQNLDIPMNELLESLEILGQRRYIEIPGPDDNSVELFHITSFGFHQYATRYIQNYDETLVKVAFEIIHTNFNDNHTTDNQTIKNSLGTKQILIDNILDILNVKNLIKMQSIIDGHNRCIVVYYASPELKRILRNF